MVDFWIYLIFAFFRKKCEIGLFFNKINCKILKNNFRILFFIK